MTWFHEFMNSYVFAMLVERKKWYFVTKIVLTHCEKHCSSDREKLLKFEAEFRTIYSSRKRSEQFLLTECFFNLFPEVSHI
jgi:hypothetical protein